mmetsp:Transcript_83078/g.253918  ORF Transcript_83078/g.253918 Transcript_83078/m.253918 type:complete len:207 (+) Transcript_83078:1095-1715(+)
MPFDGVPLRGVGPATVPVEVHTERPGGAPLGAALVVELLRRVDVAHVRAGLGLARLPHPQEVLARDERLLGARRACVERGPHVRLLVHPLQDVVLAPRRPHVLGVLAVHPEGGPHAATCRHVVDLRHEEARVIGVPRLDAHGLPALARHEDGGAVRPDDRLLERGLYQAEPLRLLRANVGDGALRWIGRRPELELGKKIEAAVRLS